MDQQVRRLFVGNLNYSVTEQELAELFSQFGTVHKINVLQGRGFGFVEMSRMEEATRAKEELNGFNFAGRIMRINDARPRERFPARHQPQEA